MRTENYRKLEKFLNGCSREELHAAFSEPWLNELVPGMKDIVGCDQGRVTHLEGDVGVHSALVFENIRATARRRLGREADFIELVSVLLHDLKKPANRVETAPGDVSFPGHERAARAATIELARVLGLTKDEENRLLFLVERHGDAHGLPNKTPEVRAELCSSPYSESLALLQEADALSCIRGDGTAMAVYWDELTRKT